MRLLLDAGSDEISAMHVFQLMNRDRHHIQLVENVIFMLFNHENSGLESHTIQNNIDLLAPRFPPYFFEKDKLMANMMEWQTEWQRISKRFSFNYQATDSHGMTCLHRSLDYQVHPHESRWDSYQVRELKWFLQNKADPCALSESEITPTIFALLFGSISEWFEALSTTGIIVEAVVLHTLKTISLFVVMSMREVLESVENQVHEESQSEVRFRPTFNRDLYDSLSNVSTLRAYIIKVFAEYGCHVNTTDFHDPNIYNLSASAVDYQPSTIYDPERTKTEIRKRNPTVTSE